MTYVMRYGQWVTWFVFFYCISGYGSGNVGNFSELTKIPKIFFSLNIKQPVIKATHAQSAYTCLREMSWILNSLTFPYAEISIYTVTYAQVRQLCILSILSSGQSWMTRLKSLTLFFHLVYLTTLGAHSPK
jgi:hypothetical protein